MNENIGGIELSDTITKIIDDNDEEESDVKDTKPKLKAIKKKAPWWRVWQQFPAQQLR